MNDKICILVVDDEQDIREIVTILLENKGYTVAQAANGVEAVRWVENHPETDLVILDIMMPELDGWQVCREIRKQSDCPIIMLTAKNELFDKVLGLELGADDYVVKPFEAKEVIARVKAVLRRCGLDQSRQNTEVQFEGL